MRDCEKPLQYLADFGHELILVQVWADEDREPPWEGELDLEDAETGAARRAVVRCRAARDMYTAAFDEYARHLRRIALRNNGRYVGLPTDVPWRKRSSDPCAQRSAGVRNDVQWRVKVEIPACRSSISSLGELIGLAGAISAGVVALYLLDRPSADSLWRRCASGSTADVRTELKHRRRSSSRGACCCNC